LIDPVMIQDVWPRPASIWSELIDLVRWDQLSLLRQNVGPRSIRSWPRCWPKNLHW
jgi:hypothetical protein